MHTARGSRASTCRSRFGHRRGPHRVADSALDGITSMAVSGRTVLNDFPVGNVEAVVLRRESASPLNVQMDTAICNHAYIH